MSHSSGIPVSDALREAFGNVMTSAAERMVKVQIVEEQLVPISTKSKEGSWEEDLSLVINLLEKDSACYVLFKQEHEKKEWILFCYVPDKAKVKDKMLYASTRSNLKQQLGSNYFIDEVFGTVSKDFSVEGYRHHVTSKKTEAPLTEQEQIRSQELGSGEIHTGGSTTYVHGVAFPVENSANQAITQLLSGAHNYVQIAIDCDAEKVILDHKGNVDLEGLKQEIHKSEPRFHFYKWTHDHDGESVSSTVFLFSCPDGSKGTKSAPVKMRMLYSSSKANVSEIIKANGGEINARFEINAEEDISEEEIRLILHPKQEEKKATFNRPSRPGKGGARMTRPTKD